MVFRNRSWLPLAVLAFSLAAMSCDDDTVTPPDGDGPDLNRTYQQVERLGNPLVSEVLFAKRDHGFHNATGPSTDVTNFTDDVQSFATNVAGRQPVVGNTLAAVLLPDMLITYTDRSGATAGWLSWALASASGYGGRTLTDDVVDAGLGALFGTVISVDEDSTTCLSTDNVGANDAAFSSTFPYLAPPH